MAVPTPLTTTFTPASNCLSEIHWDTASPWFQVGPGTQCLPDGPNPTLSSFYSPGLYCPDGYTVACSTEVTEGAATETRATCCPRATALGHLSSSSFACYLETIFQATSYGCFMRLGSLASEPLTAIATNGTTGPSAFSVNSIDGVNAFSVQIRYQASDVSAARTTSSSSTSDASASGSATRPVATPTNTATMPFTTNSPLPLNDNDGGLSTGAKIAVGVVVPVVVIAAALIAFLVLRRRKGRGHDTGAGVTGSQNIANEVPTSSQSFPETKPKYSGPSELDSNPMYETGSSYVQPREKA